jgi:hypothetical protein
MSDCAQGSETGNIAAVPSPPEARSGPAPVLPSDGPVHPVQAPVRPQRPDGCRATVRDALDAALYGIRLGGRDRQFLRRLVHWDKRNAACVASLLLRARQAGRSEVALSARQLEIVLTALEDAGLYRTSGAAAVGCWDCGNLLAAAALTTPGMPTGPGPAPSWPRSSPAWPTRPQPRPRANSSGRPT